ncbi:MAG: flagellin [Lachnospiraceae bacterium]|nr:flagellin [Lachnospiraceae bacterium]
MKINPNLQAMITGGILQSNEARFKKSSEKMTSGYKINSTRDAPARYALSNKMNAKLSSISKANNNAANAVNVIQTADGALGEVQNMLHRVKELAVRSANGTLTTEDRLAIYGETKELFAEIERIGGQTQYNNQKLLNGDQDLKGYSKNNENVSVATYNDKLPTDKEYNLVFKADGSLDIDETRKSEGFKSGRFDIKPGKEDPETHEVKDYRIVFRKDNGGELVLDCDKEKIAKTGPTTADLEIKGIGGMKIQTGNISGQESTLAIPRIDLKNMDIDSIDLRTTEGAKASFEKLDNALSFISDVRSRLGANQNQIEATIANIDASSETLTEAFSNVKDVDMAEEMVEYTRLQVLTQAGVSMLTQANESPEQALQLLS